MSENYTYHDSDFNLYRAYSYSLLLRLEETSFSYAVIQQSRLMALSLNCDLNELESPKQLSDILTSDYKRVIIGLPASGFSLIPETIFNDRYVANFARFLDVKPTQKVLAQTLDNDNVILFKTDEKLVMPFEKYNTDALVYAYRGWVKSVAKSSPLNNNLYVDINNETVHFLYFTSGILRFYNAFQFKSEDDLVYYTAFVAEELHLRPQHIALILSGDVDKGDVNMSRLGKFYPNIELNALSPIEFPAELPSHKFLALAALSLCESSVAV